MAEEQACLVRAHSDSENSSKVGSFGSISKTMAYTEDKYSNVTDGAGEPANTTTSNIVTSQMEIGDSGESGELIDYNNSSALDQFHEDASTQAGFGLAQLRVILAVSLAIGGASLELTAIPFILPSAEIELCILAHEKIWAVIITLVGASIGSLGWGLLCGRLGRRRTLLSCLAVNAVFAPVAATMPTYPTFMMARFCSSIGWGGILPASFAYVCEVSPARARRASLACVALALGAGAAAAASLARLVLPQTGHDTLLEDKEHFSAWHRYLLLCTLPILASLVSLIWTPESPRYLLEVGREVEAMTVYQNIHSSNQSRWCGSWWGATTGEYRLGELALPGKPRPHVPAYKPALIFQPFFQIFSTPYRNKTFALGGTLLFAMSIQFYLASYVPATVREMENAKFEASKRTISNVSYENELFNSTLENIEYENVTFTNCTFRDIFISHVTFQNCSFVASAFANIKSSYTTFESSSFVNCTIIDTDIEVGGSISMSCVVTGTVVRGMAPACRARLAWQLDGAAAERSYCALAAAAASVLMFLSLDYTRHIIACGLLVLLSPSLAFIETETMLYVVEAVFTFIVTYLSCSIGHVIVHTFPASSRCLCLGLVLSVCVLAGACMVGSGARGPPPSAVLCAALALLATGFSSRIR